MPVQIFITTNPLTCALDFPLSYSVRVQMHKHPNFSLTSSHKQLAAQTPSEWFRSSQSRKDSELAMTKVLYRALLSPVLDTLNAGTNKAGGG